MNKIQVLIIHEDTLVSLGIQKILNEMFNIKHVTCTNSIDKHNFDEFNLIFCSVLCYALNNEQFITNKHCYRIVTANQYCRQEQSDCSQ